MAIGQCAKTKDIIEPRLKPMWWVRCGDMAERAKAASDSGELKISPDQHKDTWSNWMKGIRDWYLLVFCVAIIKVLIFSSLSRIGVFLDSCTGDTEFQPTW